MNESLDNQLILDATECFYPDKELSLKRGRKPLITSDTWLGAVKKILTMNDSEISKELKVNKT
ncbi:MAG: hypothetical protein ACFFDN_20820, partial [Candidatus Hodarchaeota archaeon]